MHGSAFNQVLMEGRTLRLRMTHIVNRLLDCLVFTDTDFNGIIFNVSEVSQINIVFIQPRL